MACLWNDRSIIFSFVHIQSQSPWHLTVHYLPATDHMMIFKEWQVFSIREWWNALCFIWIKLSSQNGTHQVLIWSLRAAVTLGHLFLRRANLLLLLLFFWDKDEWNEWHWYSRYDFEEPVSWHSYLWFLSTLNNIDCGKHWEPGRATTWFII